MKKLLALTFFTIAIQISGFAVNYKTRKSNSGNWDHKNSWTARQSPGNVINSQDKVTIDGYYSLESSLVIHGALTVNDTLYLKNNLEITGGQKVDIVINGLLIVKGSIVIKGTFDFMIEGNGKMVVLNDVTVAGNGKSKNKKIDNVGEVYINDEFSPSDFKYSMQSNLDEAINMPMTLMSFIEAETGSTLPVELLYFRSAVEQNKVILDWATSSEENFDYFIVERSNDGINYETIAEVKGAGWSQTNQYYQFADEFPVAGISYYRLQSIDFDGYTEIFQAVSVVVESVQVAQARLIGNTLIDNTLNISYQHANDSYAQVSILKTNGEVVYQTEIQIGTQQLELQGTTQGIYLARVDAPNYQTTLKFVVR